MSLMLGLGWVDQAVLAVLLRTGDTEEARTHYFSLERAAS